MATDPETWALEAIREQAFSKAHTLCGGFQVSYPISQGLAELSRDEA